MWWIRSAKERRRSGEDTGCIVLVEDGDPTSAVTMLGVKLQVFSSKPSVVVEDKDVGKEVSLSRLLVNCDQKSLKWSKTGLYEP